MAVREPRRPPEALAEQLVGRMPLSRPLMSSGRPVGRTPPTGLVTVVTRSHTAGIGEESEAMPAVQAADRPLTEPMSSSSETSVGSDTGSFEASWATELARLVTVAAWLRTPEMVLVGRATPNGRAPAAAG